MASLHDIDLAARKLLDERDRNRARGQVIAKKLQAIRMQWRRAREAALKLDAADIPPVPPAFRGGVMGTAHSVPSSPFEAAALGLLDAPVMQAPKAQVSDDDDDYDEAEVAADYFASLEHEARASSHHNTHAPALFPGEQSAPPGADADDVL